MTVSNKKRWAAIAYHEAGHAIVAHFVEIGLHKNKAVSILADPKSLGRTRKSGAGLVHRTEWDGSDRKRLLAERHAMACLAGVEAQRHNDPRSIRSGDGSSDWSAACELLEPFVESPEELRAWMKLLLVRTRQIVTDRWRYIEALAKELLICREMTREDVFKVIESVTESRLDSRRPPTT